jgi:hypothetical protein
MVMAVSVQLFIAMLLAMREWQKKMVLREETPGSSLGLNMSSTANVQSGH